MECYTRRFLSKAGNNDPVFIFMILFLDLEQICIHTHTYIYIYIYLFIYSKLSTQAVGFFFSFLSTKIIFSPWCVDLTLLLEAAVGLFCNPLPSWRWGSLSRRLGFFFILSPPMNRLMGFLKRAWPGACLLHRHLYIKWCKLELYNHSIRSLWRLNNKRWIV